MKTRYKMNCIRIFFFVAILFFALIIPESDIYHSVGYSYTPDVIKIEAFFQPELPKEFQPYFDSISFDQQKAYRPFHIEYIVKSRKKLLLSTNNICNIVIDNQIKASLHFHHIISILQKSNIWHQSSDEDASLPDYC
jgi:hypothetical protein